MSKIAYFSISYWLKILKKYHIQARHAVRIPISVFLSEYVAHIIGLREPYWAMITAVIVTQTSITQTLVTGRDQIIGTLIGALAGIGAIALNRNGIDHTIAFTIMLIPLVIMTAIHPTIRLTIVTLVVVFMIPSVDTSPYTRPVDRVLTILVGASVSLIVSFFVLHSKSRVNAFGKVQKILYELKIIVQTSLKEIVVWTQIENRNRRCMELMNDVNLAIQEAKQENIGHSLEKHEPVLVRLPYLLRRLQSDCIFVARAIDEGASFNRTEESLAKLDAAFEASFDRLIGYCHLQAQKETVNVPHSEGLGEIRMLLVDMKSDCDPVLYFILVLLSRDLARMESILRRHIIVND